MRRKCFCAGDGMGVSKGGYGPPVFTHDTANVFFKKHSLCENILTLTTQNLKKKKKFLK